MNVSVFTDISLLRHGEAEGGARYRGVTDDPLTPGGQAQMWAAVGEECRWDVIVSSPLARCAAFAVELARRHALPLRLDARLRELDFGAWDGRSAEDIMRTDAQALARFWENPWRHTPPAGEPLAQLRARVLAAWQDIVAARSTTLVVTHGGPIRVIHCHVWGRPPARLLEIDVPLASLRRLLVPVPHVPMEAHAS